MMSSPTKITLPVIFSKMTPRKDRSWKLEFETRELGGHDVEVMANRLGTEGWLLHSQNNDITVNEVPESNADSGLEGKSPSRRLRDFLWVWWDQHGRPEKTFELFYASQMERLTEYIKSRLED